MTADAVAAPLDRTGDHTERLVHLPHSLLPANHRYLHPNASLQLGRPPPPREQFGLPAEGFVFCAFNTLYKVNTHTSQHSQLGSGGVRVAVTGVATGRAGRMAGKRRGEQCV
jgi:predicted O-linked N-acetylglucosamine transferase (SPINDLY family)